MKMALKSHGITEKTPENLLFSAGAIYKNLKYSEETGWAGTVLGATNGGITLSITPEYVDAEMDGASVPVKGAKIKVAETATMESNMTEFSEGVIKDSLHLELDTTANISGYKKYVSKRSISKDDYLENIAYVGTLVSGKQIIVILPNAICTSALELQGQNKTQATYTITFECTASFEQTDLEHLPYEIYYPQDEVISGD
ncbi:hypothetical protein M9Y10_042526 [Tritrichomonas musculus]|uniref:Uncharacterized protein n=2 Tax=Tritrichomonas musculus TaxID=1915356 RepID=A0ABR2GK69_9EUKA